MVSTNVPCKDPGRPLFPYLFDKWLYANINWQIILLTGLGWFRFQNRVQLALGFLLGGIYGDHVVSCAGNIGINHRHYVVCDILINICCRSRISVGLDVCVDMTGSSPLTHNGMAVSSRVVFDTVQRNSVKYEANCAAIRYDFLHFAFTTLGKTVKDEVGLPMVQDIEARAAVHKFNMIIFAITKGVGHRISRFQVKFLNFLSSIMSAITDIRWVLTQRALSAFCDKYHIPEELYPVLPNQNDTMHERPAGKIGLMDGCPLVSVAPVCYTKPLDSFKSWNDHFFWVDYFACPASFPWHTAKHVTRDPAPVAVDFNAQDYATLVAHPSPFWKFPEAFLCLVGLSRYYPLDEETYPRILHKNGEVKIVKRERNKDEPLLLATTIGRTVPLLLVAPDRAETELEASVDRLFDEGGSGNKAEQGNSAGVGEGANIQPVVKAADTVVEVVAPVQPRRQGKRKSVVVDAGGASHPPKKLREDHGTPSGGSVGGKSQSTIKRLLVGAVLNAKVRVTAIPTLPFVIVSVSSTPEREDGGHTDFVAEPNLRTIGASQRFVISSNSSHHSGPTIAEAEVDSLARSSVPIMTTVTTVTSTADPALVAKEKPVKPSLFSIDSSSAGEANPNTGVFSDLTGSDFLVGGIRTIIDPNTDLQKVYVPQWSVTNGSRLDDGRVCREMVDEFAPPKFFTSVRGMEHDQLFTEFNVGAARQMCLSAEVRMRAEYNVKEKRSLKSEVEKQNELLKVKEEEIGNLKARLLLREAEAAEAICLRAEASNFEAVEKSLRDETIALKERNVILEKERNALDVKSQNDNFVDWVHELEVSSSRLQEKVTLYTDFVEMALHLEEKFYPRLLTTISGRRWLMTQGMKLAITKCLNPPEYLSALGAAIGKAIEKGMQDGLSAGITHGKEGRVLTDVAAHNPSAEVDYIAALQRIQNVNFPLQWINKRD
ncbi:hypothetical protein Tco_0302578 [Tanacetum coccineum]